MKKILVIFGHPQLESYCGALAAAYVEGATQAGHEVQELKLADLSFEPVLRAGFETEQALEPDLVKAQQLITWCDHMVWVYPTWWGAMPAFTKGFIERVFLPEFAFHYRENSPMWDRLLTGRTAHLIVTMDSPSLYYRFVFHRPGHNLMKHGILGFCGIKLKKITEITMMRQSTRQKRERWLEKVKALGASA